MQVVVVVGFGFFFTDIALILLLGSGMVLGPVIEAAGPVAISVAAIAIALFATVSCFKSLGTAIEQGNVHWAFDIFLAPIAAILSVFLIFLNLNVWHDWITFEMQIAKHQTPGDLVIGFCLACLWWVLAISGPAVAVTSMRSESGFVRLASYGGFIATAATWGIFITLVMGGSL